MSARWLGALAATALMALVSCGPGASRDVEAQPPEWAAAAETWLDGYAASKPALGLMPYVSRDVVFDQRGMLNIVARGRGEMLQAYTRPMEWNDDAVRNVVVPPYLSVDGAVLLEKKTAMPSGFPDFDLALVLDVGPGGVERETETGAMWMAEAYLSASVRPEAGHALGDRYVDAWSAGDPGAVESLYAAGATVTDTLRGVVEASPADAAARLGPLTGATILPLPDHGRPAVLGQGWLHLGNTFDTVVLLLEADVVPGCRGNVAVALDVAGPSLEVTRERRYHRVDDARRCLDAGTLPDGWWSVVQQPHPEAVNVGLVAAPPRVRTAVWNTDPGVEGLLLWAYGRFAAAGLPVPAPRWVVVETADVTQCLADRHASVDPLLTVCGNGGRACVDEACTAWRVEARAQVLHALGHRWLTRPLVSGQPGTSAEAERVADVVAWGLLDQTWTSPRIAADDCAALAAQFRAVTGTEPLNDCQNRG